MAVMTDTDRQELWGEFMSRLSGGRESTDTLTKADLRAALNAVDDWVSDNQASFNSAIPQPARGVLTTPQKVRLLNMVVDKRFDLGV